MIRLVLVVFLYILQGSVAAVFAGEPGYKYRVAKAVYDDLVNAFGDGRRPPVFKLIPREEVQDMMVAAFVPGDVPAIVLEEQAYDVCRSFGADSLNALACIIGHELSHYYLKHDWCSNFYRSMSHLGVASQLRQIDGKDQLKKEAEADYHGFFYGSIAGYQTFDIAAELFDRLYQTYSLPSELAGYPSLQQRKEAAVQSRAMVLRRWPVFEAGVYLYAVGAYEMAYACFSNLLTDFTSRENYNNAAVCLIKMAMPPDSRYPLALDYTSRTAPTRGSAGLSVEEQRKAWLQEARKLLEESIRKDPGYSYAKINLAICHILLGNTDMANGVLNEINQDLLIRKGSLTLLSNDMRFTNLESLSIQMISDQYLNEIQLSDILPSPISEISNISNDEPSSDTLDHQHIYDCLRSVVRNLASPNLSILLQEGKSIHLKQGNVDFEKGIVVRDDLKGVEWEFYTIKQGGPCGQESAINETLPHDFIRIKSGRALEGKVVLVKSYRD